ncbi:MAG: aminopeptidase P family protein [Methanosarcinales archaeon]|nr:aminopeptidase P family protein [Methanosarcinales archaeon]
MSDKKENAEEPKKPLLIVSESMRNADMYYATRFLAADPFIYLRFHHELRDILIVSQMEYERARKESIVNEVRSTLDYGYDLKMEELIIKILREEHVEAIEVPRYFQLYTAEELRKNGIEVVPVEEVTLTKEREIKDEQEITFMKKAQSACEKAMALALTVIKKSTVNGNVLMENGEILTSERIKAHIEHALIDAGCTCDGGEPIVACGKKAADPHFSGSGPLLANEPIIIDIFPRLKVERYFADMTRTIVKGEPGKEIKEMYEAVLEAQNAALALVKEGITCREVHNCVCDIFEERGYETLRKGGKKGFIHSTGHGVGLNVHENPRVSDNEYVLRKGNVITIEPGLYDPEVGGVRLEDMVLVLKNGCENLTRFEKKPEV